MVSLITYKNSLPLLNRIIKYITITCTNLIYHSKLVWNLYRNEPWLWDRLRWIYFKHHLLNYLSISYRINTLNRWQLRKRFWILSTWSNIKNECFTINKILKYQCRLIFILIYINSQRRSISRNCRLNLKSI